MDDIKSAYALGFLAGRDAAATEAFYACGCKDSIEALAPPAYLSAALTARLDAAWNDAIEAAADKLTSTTAMIFTLGDCVTVIRALRRAAPTEDR